MKVSSATARRLALSVQGLAGGWKLPKGKEGVAQTVERLGYVQIDTIAVVARAHHHTLWARRPDYAPRMLHELLAEDRRIFEYWCPAASYVPMSDYRFYIPAMRRRHTPWFRANAKLVRQVKARIRREGPLGSADFAAPEGEKRSWWGWKPAKHALEILFAAGEVMISERRNFQRRYDLAERVLPSSVDTRVPAKRELDRFRVVRALRHAGVATGSELGWATHRRAAPGRALQELLQSREVTAFGIEDLDDDPCYALTEVLETVAKKKARRRDVHILSPFDNLVIRRGRLQRLFGFACKLECYLPAARRRYGYFCLPILWGDAFVARIDAKAERKARRLLVKRLIFEPGFAGHEKFLPPLARKLYDFAAFNGCDTVAVERTIPAKAAPAVKRALRERGK